MLPYIAAVILGIGALGGLTLAILHLSRKHVPLWAALIHGLIVLPGVVILAIAVVTHGKAQGRGSFSFIYLFEIKIGIALVIFIIAALGGLIMFIMHGQRRRLPPLLIMGHGLIALSGYAVLLWGLF